MVNCPYNVKICNKCRKMLIVCNLNFDKQKSGKYGFRNRCKKCRKEEYQENREQELEKRRKNYEKNKKYYNKLSKQYYEEHKEEIVKQKKRYRKEHKEELREKSKIYREENKDKIAKYKKQYYEEHKEELVEYYKQWYEENKEYHNEKSKQYYEEHKEEIVRQHKEYYEEHKEEILKKQRQYHKENPHIKFNASNKRRSRLEEQGKGVTKDQWCEMMLFFDFKCAYSDKYIGGDSKDRTVDHIIALNNGGLNEIWNCVPCFKKYNYQKHTNNMEEWYKQQPFYSEERLEKIYIWVEYAWNKWGYKRRKGNKKTNK